MTIFVALGGAPMLAAVRWNVISPVLRHLMQAMFSLVSPLQPFVDVSRKALFGGALRDIPQKTTKP